MTNKYKKNTENYLHSKKRGAILCISNKVDSMRVGEMVHSLLLLMAIIKSDSMRSSQKETSRKRHCSHARIEHCPIYIIVYHFRKEEIHV